MSGMKEVVNVAKRIMLQAIGFFFFWNEVKCPGAKRPDHETE